jgi:hypothetical protein
MIQAEMTHTVAVAETIDKDNRTVNIDILKKQRSRDCGVSDKTGNTRSVSEKWTGLNDSSAVKMGMEEGGGDATEKSGNNSVAGSSEPRKRVTRRNSNESAYSQGSNGSSGSKNSSKSASKRKTTTKRRSWKKPKDKPKRPLSAYNIFFKHTRSRIVEGLLGEGSPEETIASIEGIVANSTETRRHRKTHGQISFGDLARTIADKWKTIDATQMAIFDHYAALDMKRYRRDVSIWKAKKEAEALAASSGGESRANGQLVSLEVSGSSHCSLSYYTDSQTTVAVGENYDDWNTPQHRSSLSTSFHSTDSTNEEFTLEPLPIADLPESQQNCNSSMIGRSVPSYIESSSNMNIHIMNNIMMAPDNHHSMNPMNGYNTNNPNNSSLQNKKLQEIWLKNRELEESINKLKKELSVTNFSLGDNSNSNNATTNNNCNNANNQNSGIGHHQGSAMTTNNPFPAGPSIDRMQQLHQRRLRMGDILPPMGNRNNNGNDQGQQQQLNGSNNNSSHSHSHSHCNQLESVDQALVGIDVQMQLDNPFDLNPVPFEDVFNASGAEAIMKKRELITNLNQLDFFRNGGGGNC